jgi:phosphoglycerate dehydrogenase-like enzyme
MGRRLPGAASAPELRTRNMRIVLWATFARTELIGRLKPLLGEGLAVVANIDELGAQVAEADALLCPDFLYGAQVAQIVRERAKRLRWLQLLTQGYENAQAHGVPSGIAVTTAGDAYSPAVAMHAVALLLAVQRRFPAMLANQMQGEWNRTVSLEMTSPAGATVAILGFGSIGQEIARLVRAFGAKVVALTRSARPHALADESLPIGELHRVLPRADAVVLALPLDATTRHLIGARELALLRKTAVLVNISRGGIVDTAVLVEALQSRAIAGAGLDVTDPEPLPAGHPLWAAPNVIISPHLAGAAGKAGFDRLADVAARNVERFLAGQPLAHVVAVSGSDP